MNWQPDTTAQFFYFQLSLNLICHGQLQNKMGIVHIQCLLRIDGSILAGVFLTSSFCVVPESSGSSNTAPICTCIELGTPTALVQLIVLSQQCMASFKNWHTIGGSRRHWQLFSSVDPYTVVSDQFRLQLLTVKLFL